MCDERKGLQDESRICRYTVGQLPLAGYMTTLCLLLSMSVGTVGCGVLFALVVVSWSFRSQDVWRRGAK
jgi:hypothetical protein